MGEPSKADYDAAMKALALRVEPATRSLLEEMAALFCEHRHQSLAAWNARGTP